MASCAPSLQEELTCSVCLSLYDDPVQLQCRHNLCRACFRRMCELNTYVRCPECQTDVTGRRVEANMKLRNVVDSYFKSITSGGGGGRFKLAGGCRSLDACSSSSSSPPSSPSSPSSPAVPCSFCRRDAQRPAVRTCAKCEVSFCEEHVRPHYENSCFRGHVLLQPTARLAERRCTDHDEPLKLYCAVDDALVCSVCVLAGGHRDHPVRTLTQHAHHVRDLLEDKTRNLEGKIGLFEKFLQQAEQKNQEIELKTDRLKKEASDMLDTIRHHLIQEEEKVRRNIEKDATRARQVVAAAVAHVSSSDLKALHEVKTTIEKITEEKDDFYLLKAYSSHVKSLNAVSAIAVPKIQRDFEVQDEVVPADWLQRVVKGIPINEPEKASLAFEGAVQHAMLRISNEGRTVTVSAHPQLGFAGLYHPPHRRHGRSARPRGERQLAHAPLPLHGNPFKDMWNIMCSQGFAYGRQRFPTCDLRPTGVLQGHGKWSVELLALLGSHAQSEHDWLGGRRGLPSGGALGPRVPPGSQHFLLGPRVGGQLHAALYVLARQRHDSGAVPRRAAPPHGGAGRGQGEHCVLRRRQQAGDFLLRKQVLGALIPMLLLGQPQ
ncbi:E3 ubiquitin/ISG15 ligase TRIM25-like isoform X1 [Lampetra planeri]